MLTITSGSGVGWPDPGNQAQCAVPLPEAPLSPPLAHCEGNLMLTPGPLLPRTCPVSPGRARVHCAARVHTGHVCCSHVTTGRVTALLRPALSGGGRGGWPGQVDWYRCPTWCTGYTVIMGYPTWYSGYIHYYYRTPNMVQWCLLVFSGLCLHSKLTYVRLIGLLSQPKTQILASIV